MFSFPFAPKGWAVCSGQTLLIAQNQALFSLLGTTYGGNGTTNFALPNQQGRVAIHSGSGHTPGEKAGEESHTLTFSEMPAHSHVLSASKRLGDSLGPRTGSAGNLLAADPGNAYSAAAVNAAMLAPATVGTTGGSQPHENRQPYLTLSFCIALSGIFPSRN